MSYRIDARLEQGNPTLTLIDVPTGEVRLHWRSDGSKPREASWNELFKKLLLLSCADGMNLIKRSQSPLLGEECLHCDDCSGIEIHHHQEEKKSA